jgi:four helix bundle protein
MGRDHTKLRFFATADALPIHVYKLTESLPASERYGLQSQMRRASVSAVVNIVEGACRKSDKVYCQFLETSLGSASETRYLLQLCARLNLMQEAAVKPMIDDYSMVIKGLQALITTIERSRKPEAES